MLARSADAAAWIQGLLRAKSDQVTENVMLSLAGLSLLLTSHLLERPAGCGCNPSRPGWRNFFVRDLHLHLHLLLATFLDHEIRQQGSRLDQRRCRDPPYCSILFRGRTEHPNVDENLLGVTV